MAYGYLLAPSFQFVNINGRPLVGGHIEVFIHNTDTKYITKADFDGTDNPFKIPLNSKGMAVVIASGDYAYDVFCYDRFGSLFWSGSNIRIEGATGVVIDGANLPLRIVGGKIDNNGKELTCTGENAWAEGAETTASGANAHAEGGLTTASGEHSHSEGFSTTASSGYSHAEGAGSKATNTASHAEGQDTTASGQASHAEGRGSVASGDYSHASGRGTRATNEGSHAVGKFNDDGEALFVVGNGTKNNQRHDAFKVDRNGDTWVSINGVLTKVTNVSGGGGGDQFVLVRSNMTTDFTNEEYQDCVNAVTNGKAVCVQYGSNQVQLASVAGGALHFDGCSLVENFQYVVSPMTGNHTITRTSAPIGGDCKVEIFNCTEPYWPNPTEMFDSYNDGKDVVIVRQSLSGVIHSVWRLENVVEDLGLVKNYTLEFQNEDGDTTATHKTKRVKFHSTDYENWTTTEKTFYYPERETIAPNWNALDVSNYKKGTLVYRAGVLYHCKTNSPSGSWVDSEWEETDVSKEISGILEEQNMVLKHLKTNSVVSYELNGNLATATITLPTDKTLSTARLDNGGAKNTFISASVENVIKKAKISLGGAGKVLSRVQLSGMISIDVKIDSSESQSGTDVLISSILLKIGEWGEWEEKNIPIDFSSITTESWSSSYRDSKPVRLVIDHSVTEFTLEDFNIQDDFVNQTLDIFIELGIKADKTTTSNGTGLID